MQTPVDPKKKELLAAILPHVAFDGWSQSAFDAAVAEVDINPEHAKTMCPRGAVDLAIMFHQEGDRAMVDALSAMDLSELRIRDRIAKAIETRLSVVEDKEAVRRGSVLFALPHMAPEGSKLIWGTADAIWDALGDPSRDVNWYTKRATLSAVYTSVVLYWLGDDSLDGQATNAFISRRIDNVMTVEKVKASARANPLLKPFLGPLDQVLGQIKAPNKMPAVDLPGMWRDPE